MNAIMRIAGRALMVAALLTVGAASADAKNPLKVKSGDEDVFNDKKSTAIYTVDLKGATWEEEETFEAYSGDEYAKRVEIISQAWKNEAGEELNLKAVDSDARYTVCLRIDNFEQKQALTSTWGRMYIRIYGTITVTDNTTGEAVCVITVDGSGGDPDYVQNDRFPKTIKELVENIDDLVD